MSDAIKHECGIALLRLKKPLQFYVDKYGSAFYGLKKLHLLMEKQHNRGQDGAGVASVKLNVTPGDKYISRYRSKDTTAIQDIFNKINGKFNEIAEKNPSLLKDTEWLSKHASFTGQLLLGHLRYGTFGRNTISSCHPFLRQSNWMSRNLVLAGNFNLTNVKELFEKLVELGYNDLASHFAFNKDAASNLDWFYHLTGGHTHTDFFAVRPTDYSKANEGEDFEDIW